MRKVGRAAQARECARRLAVGGSPSEETEALEERLRQLSGQASSPSLHHHRSRRWLCRLAAVVLTWLTILHLGACAGPDDLRKAMLGLPAHPSAAELAVSIAASTPFHRRVALVTGATSGVGLETAGALAEAGFNVLMGARSPKAAAEALTAVQERARKRGRGGTAELLDLDLSDLKSVARAARSVGGSALHVLICSAGVMPSPLGAEYSETSDGIETVWGVNHLGHFALANALRPALRRAAREGFPARLVLVTSEHGHRYFAADGLPPILPPSSEGWNAFAAYGVSKLSNVLHASEAAERWWAADGVAAFAVHPGIVGTALGQMRQASSASAPPSALQALHNFGVWLWWHVIAWPVAERVESGAASVVFAALSPSLAGLKFAYVKHCQRAQPAAAALDASAAAFLWAESERLVRQGRVHGK